MLPLYCHELNVQRFLYAGVGLSQTPAGPFAYAKIGEDPARTETVLTIAVKAVSESPYGYAISTGHFRVKIGEDKFAPDNFYSEAIPGFSFKTFDIIFSLPANVNQIELLQYYGENLLGSVSMQLK